MDTKRGQDEKPIQSLARNSIARVAREASRSANRGVFFSAAFLIARLLWVSVIAAQVNDVAALARSSGR
jgi:hypothetical protein